ncbi:MAG: ornithine cyclodeaminase family protein [Planctomycetes bacterium]|nr:ornithine cyclodeaminase family protein [Planctomycetota bacterium]
MLFLSGDDVLAALSCEAAMGAVAEAMRRQEIGAYRMPERTAIEGAAQGSCLLLMPCQTESSLATKLVTVFPGNAEKRLPLIDGIVSLFDARTGQLQALLDGKALTARRTGAVSGLAIRYLSDPEARTLGLVGVGAQAIEQLRHAAAVRPLERVYLFSCSREECETFATRFAEEFPQICFEVVSSAGALLDASQIVLTATTARSPVLPDDSGRYRGKLCIAIGSFESDVREYPDAVFAHLEGVWVDTINACKESGELRIPLATGRVCIEEIETLGAHMQRAAAATVLGERTRFFKSVGMGLFDLCAAEVAVAAAREAGLGERLGEE